ncbi:hypothetical protein [Christiangramia sp.]|uniref:hypothetical protein n=1 Tax=Christiangramia sp. TaxID=1931228 RepID=UPI0026294C88|nr:hypothetical protein [Christiangramia sp.]
MSKEIKIGLLIAYVVVGLFFVYIDKVTLTEFTAGLGIYLTGIISYKEAFEEK